MALTKNNLAAILRDPRSYIEGRPSNPPSAPAPTQAGAPAATPAARAYDRGAVEQLAKGDERDQVLARMGVLSNPRAHIESGAAPTQTTVELAQAQLDARVAKATAAGVAEAEAKIAGELGVSIADAKRLLAPAAPVAPPAPAVPR